MRTYALTDIHGMSDLLHLALGKIEAESAGQPARVVFTGDYVDRGPDSVGVIERLIRGPTFQEHEWVCLQGNHDQMMHSGDEGWHLTYGKKTIESYKKKYGGAPAWPYLGEAALANFQTHKHWLRGLPTHFEDDHRIFVHAGLRPGRTLAEQSENDKLWIREEFLYADHDFGKMVVHGHTPTWLDQPNKTWLPTLLPGRTNLDTGACFGSEGGKLTLAWWDDDQFKGFEQFSKGDQHDA